MDLTLKTYKILLEKLLEKKYSFLTFQDYINKSNSLLVTDDSLLIIFRHDVDRLPGNALKMARLEKEMDISATYFFRTKPCSYDEKTIKEIADMGHEIGYHYENLSDIAKREKNISKKKLYELAIGDFQKNLEKLRKLYPVKTICMHGSPLSKVDNQDLWKVYDYHDYGIIGEPYFNIDFNDVFYLTDTGRRWNGENVAVRDKVKSKKNKGKSKWPSYHSTPDIIQAVEKGNFPDKAMIVIHPQRWTDKSLPWLKELVLQNVKNIGKRVLVNIRREGWEQGVPENGNKKFD